MRRFSLRPYQNKGIDEVYSLFREGLDKLVFQMATGTGKTFSYCAITSDAVDYNLPVVIVVRRRDLIDQGSRNLTKWGIKHGVYMSGHRKYYPKRDVQICSIDTLDARETYPLTEKNPLIIIDESHDCTPKTKKYVKFLKAYPNSKVVGFTATPYSDNSLFQKVVNPITPSEAMMNGFLVPVKIYTPANQIDVSNIKKKKKGDFDKTELFKASSSSKIVGDFVRDWKLYSQGRPTVLFAVNIEHSKMIAEAFNKAGIKAVHADANTKGSKRELLLKKLARGDIKVMCNVNIFSTGVDVPEVSCIQVCRPTKSLIWYLQAVGRGLRPSPETGKNNCIIIDNAGNTFRFGSPYKDHPVSMEKKGSIDDDDMEDVSIRECKKCHFVFEANEKICPECNFVNPPVERNIKQEDGELVEYNMSEEEKEQMERGMIVADCHKLSAVAKRTPKINRKRGWVMHRLKDKYGVDKMIKYRDLINNTITLEA